MRSSQNCRSCDARSFRWQDFSAGAAVSPIDPRLAPPFCEPPIDGFLAESDELFPFTAAGVFISSDCLELDRIGVAAECRFSACSDLTESDRIEDGFSTCSGLLELDRTGVGLSTCSGLLELDRMGLAAGDFSSISSCVFELARTSVDAEPALFLDDALDFRSSFGVSLVDMDPRSCTGEPVFCPSCERLLGGTLLASLTSTIDEW